MHSIMRVRVLEILFLIDNLYYIRAKTELQKISTTSCEKNPRKNVRLNSDREYLKQLEATLAQQQDGNAGDVVLRYIIGLQFSLPSHYWIFVQGEDQQHSQVDGGVPPGEGRFLGRL